MNEYSDKKENTPQEYESLLIKLEKEIRGHIQTENQVKLYAETLQNNLEELENENKALKEKLKIEESFNINTNSNTNTNDVTKDKILELKNELEKNKKVLNSYEQQNLKLSENERKLKSKLVKELKLMRLFKTKNFIL